MRVKALPVIDKERDCLVIFERLPEDKPLPDTAMSLSSMVSAESFFIWQSNVVLTGAGQDIPGNGAPYHRVRLKT